ncbi:MAG: ClpXP protease specificity-enhancing factor SspB [Paracoccaceae bacterium]
MSNDFNYGQMMQKAMQGLLKSILQRVVDDGLPGEHHFYITFDTSHPGVEMAEWLKEAYPEEITIVMQEWFDGLAVMSDHFTVTLNFNDTPEPMVIPLDAIRAFVDPSVEFGLRFDPQDNAVEDLDELPDFDDDEEEHKDAEVVSLDAFRKPT